MSHSNGINFLSNLVDLYKSAEKAIGAKCIQDGLNNQIGHVVSIVSLIALGYFASQNSDKALLGAGFAAGMIFSWIDPTCGKIPSLQKGAILPMNQTGYFAFQKVCFVAMFFGKNFALPTGFFAGNAFYHYAASFKT